jgi:hypothetical protein
MEESDDPESNTQHFPKRIRTRRRADRNPARSAAPDAISHDASVIVLR